MNREQNTRNNGHCLKIKLEMASGKVFILFDYHCMSGGPTLLDIKCALRQMNSF